MSWKYQRSADRKGGELCLQCVCKWKVGVFEVGWIELELAQSKTHACTVSLHEQNVSFIWINWTVTLSRQNFTFLNFLMWRTCMNVDPASSFPSLFAWLYRTMLRCETQNCPIAPPQNVSRSSTVMSLRGLVIQTWSELFSFCSLWKWWLLLSLLLQTHVKVSWFVSPGSCFFWICQLLKRSWKR